MFKQAKKHNFENYFSITGIVNEILNIIKFLKNRKKCEIVKMITGLLMICQEEPHLLDYAILG